MTGSASADGVPVHDLVAVMDRLRSPGGCPWDARQTHASLATYLLEETYEVLEALDSGDRQHLREELGDLLLQVVFHARLAEEHPDDPWGIDEVAKDIVHKLVARHPHVFAGAAVDGAEEVEANWDAIKTAEKQRTSLLDGIPAALPALARADKMLGRVARSGLDVAVPADDDSYGARLLALVAEARAAGVDPEAALRRTTSALADRIVAAEAAASF
ncbi:MAG: MazG family protein [Actinomycetota bacterium]|nr:MazG family protein [Actinomycetota bacterium]